jgi:hypothetical protein
MSSSENKNIDVYTKKELVNKVEMLIREIEDKDLQTIKAQIEQIIEIMKEVNNDTLYPLFEYMSEIEDVLHIIGCYKDKIGRFKEKYL